MEDLCEQCQDFATTLLGHARTSAELQTLLNHDATTLRTADEGWEPGEKQSLERLKLAIKYKQKKVFPTFKTISEIKEILGKNCSMQYVKIFQATQMMAILKNMSFVKIVCCTPFRPTTFSIHVVRRITRLPQKDSRCSGKFQ